MDGSCMVSDMSRIAPPSVKNTRWPGRAADERAEDGGGLWLDAYHGFVSFSILSRLCSKGSTRPEPLFPRRLTVLE